MKGQHVVNRPHGTRGYPDCGAAAQNTLYYRDCRTGMYSAKLGADLIIPGSQVRVLPRQVIELPAIVGLSTRYRSHPQRLGASSGQSTAVIRHETGPAVNTD